MGKKPEKNLGVTGVEEKKARGTQNELEVMRLILEENPSLKKRVLNNIRQRRTMKKYDIFERLKNKKGDKPKKPLTEI